MTPFDFFINPEKRGNFIKEERCRKVDSLRLQLVTGQASFLSSFSPLLIHFVKIYLITFCAGSLPSLDFENELLKIKSLGFI